MAGRGGAPTFAKRQRENAKREKKKRKQERLQERRQGGDDRPAPDGIDPDIAHIQPGPQPHPFLDDDELGDTSGSGGGRRG